MRTTRLALTPFVLALIAGTAAAQSATQRIAERTKGAVISIDHRISMLGRRMSPRENPLDNSARTAGFVISAQGHIITTARFVAGKTRIRVRFQGGIKAYAKVVGVDVLNSTAVLKLEKPGAVAARFNGRLPHLTWGSSASLKPGHTIFAIGNMFDALALDGQPTFTQGVVTSMGRMRTRAYSGVAIEVDAAVNPGSFGGPLLDRKGNVVGVVTRAYSHRRWLGAAVPGDQVRFGAEALMNGRKLTHGRLGIALKTTGGEAKPNGLLISRVLAGSAAAKAGVTAGDRLVKLNGRAVYDTDDVARELNELAPGSPVRLKVIQSGVAKLIKAVLDPGGAPVTRTLARVPDPAPVRRPRPRPTRPRLSKPVSLGLRVEERDSGIGLKVLSVRPGGVAARAGVRADDVLMRLGAARLNSLKELSDVLHRYRAGETARLLLIRNRRVRRIRVRFGGPTATRPRPRPRPVRPLPQAIPAEQRGYMGVLLDLESDLPGARVDGTVDGGPASNAGLREGDTIIAVNNRRIRNVNDLVAILKSKRPNARLALQVRRGRRVLGITVALGHKPGTQPAPKPTPTPTPTPAPTTGRPWLGVALSDESGKLVVQQVDERGSLGKVGVRAGDIIRSWQGTAVTTLDGLAALLKNNRPGQTVKVKLERDGWSKVIDVRLRGR